jgi:hypothetical protein
MRGLATLPIRAGMETAAGGRYVTSRVRPGLRIAAAEGPCETEADRAAGQVMFGMRPGTIAGIREDSAGTLAAPAIAGQALTSAGHPIEASVRQSMESRFGHDFSQVRIHSDDRAAESAEALDAGAYTLGNSIVFGHGQYAPRRAEGERLLAHELAHVVQQRVSGPQVIPLIHRETLSKTLKTRPWYVLSDGKQVKSGASVSGVDMPLEYDTSTKLFRITFPLDWVFAHSWDDSTRNEFVSKFMESVKRVWDNRFLLVESEKPHRTANVKVEFLNYIHKQVKSEKEDAINDLYENRKWDNRPDGLHWVMDLRNPKVRPNVSGSTVSLSESSNKPQTLTEDEWSAGRSAVSRPAGSTGKKKYTHTASPHEFGHMIGLSDEYLEDLNMPGLPKVDPARLQINDRIMNVGERVTADAYAPFADWLSFVTGTSWKVGKSLR